VAKVYIVSFRTHDDRPSKFIVLADNMKSAINKVWEHGGADFQSRFDKSTAQAQEMKEGATNFVIVIAPHRSYACLRGGLPKNPVGSTDRSVPPRTGRSNGHRLGTVLGHDPKFWAGRRFPSSSEK
jgi:hypothetical protein